MSEVSNGQQILDSYLTNDVVTVFQYKYQQEEFNKLISEAYQDVFLATEQLLLITKDKKISVNRNILMVFSPVIRSIFDSLKCCSTYTITIPDCSSVAIEHLMNILSKGRSSFQGDINTSELIQAANCLQINISNFEYEKKSPVPFTTNSNRKPKEKQPSPNDDEIDIKLEEGFKKEKADNLGNENSDNLNEAAAVFGSTETIFIKKVNELDVKSEEEMNQETVSVGFEDVTRRQAVISISDHTTLCMLCKKKTENMLLLWQHYCQEHFQSQLLIECGKYANLGTLQCKICQMLKRNTQELFFHIGIVHQILNVILKKSGLPPLDPPSTSNMTPKSNGVELKRSGSRSNSTLFTPKVNVPSPASQYTPDNLCNKTQSSGFPEYSQSIQTTKMNQSQPEKQIMGPSMGLWAQSASNRGASTYANLPPSELQTTFMTPADKTIANPCMCLICQKPTPSNSALMQHYARFHFFTEIKSRFNFMANIELKTCKECGSVFKSVDALFLHIGIVHKKLNELMDKKGVPCPEVRGRKSM